MRAERWVMLSASTNYISLSYFTWIWQQSNREPLKDSRERESERGGECSCCVLAWTATGQAEVMLKLGNRTKPSRLTDINLTIWILSSALICHKRREDRVITCGHLQVLYNIVCFLSLTCCEQWSGLECHPALLCSASEGHFTHKPRAVTLSWWGPLTLIQRPYHLCWESRYM